jgi:DNA-binding XRE family transcriptional regulator
MDKRFTALSLPQQLALRKQAVEDVLNAPHWSLRESIRHLKTTLHLTSAEMAKLAGISHRTLQDIEQGRSQGTVQTMNQILGVLGLRLGVVRAAPDASASPANPAPPQPFSPMG